MVAGSYNLLVLWCFVVLWVVGCVVLCSLCPRYYYRLTDIVLRALLYCLQSCCHTSDAVVIDGVDDALVFGVRGDNSGPPSAAEVKKDWAAIQKMFPSSKVRKASRAEPICITYTPVCITYTPVCITYTPVCI